MIPPNEPSGNANELPKDTKSALAASDYDIDRKNIHPDPVLCRLRLNDPLGKPMANPKLFFRDCKVVAFLFGTAWKYDRNSFQSQVIELCRRNPHRFKCIYVSIDANRAEFDSATATKPWASMIWEDGSNLEDEKPVQLEKIQFATPEEQKLIKKMLAGEVTLKEDPRPISRVGLCAGLEMLFAPTLAIYHLESKTWLNMNVSQKLIDTKEKRELALEKWENGERLNLSWADIVAGMRWAIMIMVIGVSYLLLVRSNESYNVVNLVEKLLFPTTSPSSESKPPLSSSHAGPKVGQYVEF